jgi:hypothetical protein
MVDQPAEQRGRPKVIAARPKPSEIDSRFQWNLALSGFTNTAKV